MQWSVSTCCESKRGCWRFARVDGHEQCCVSMNKRRVQACCHAVLQCCRVANSVFGGNPKSCVEDGQTRGREKGKMLSTQKRSREGLPCHTKPPKLTTQPPPPTMMMSLLPRAYNPPTPLLFRKTHKTSNWIRACQSWSECCSTQGQTSGLPSFERDPCPSSQPVHHTQTWPTLPGGHCAAPWS